MEPMPKVSVSALPSLPVTSRQSTTPSPSSSWSVAETGRLNAPNAASGFRQVPDWSAEQTEFHAASARHRVGISGLVESPKVTTQSYSECMPEPCSDSSAIGLKPEGTYFVPY